MRKTLQNASNMNKDISGWSAVVSRKNNRIRADFAIVEAATLFSVHVRLQQSQTASCGKSVRDAFVILVHHQLYDQVLGRMHTDTSRVGFILFSYGTSLPPGSFIVLAFWFPSDGVLLLLLLG